MNQLPEIDQQVANELINQKAQVSVAESCSGGLLAHRLTNIAGSSQFFKNGIITYHNVAKHQLLNIGLQRLQTEGAVSNFVACAMAHNVAKLFESDWGIGITGVAGPSQDDHGNPVGKVIIGIASDHAVYHYAHYFIGDRIAIKWQATTHALQHLLEHLQ